MKQSIWLTLLLLASVFFGMSSRLDAQPFGGTFLQDLQRITFADGSEMKGRIYYNTDEEGNPFYTVEDEQYKSFDTDYYDVVAVEPWTNDRPPAPVREDKPLPTDPKSQAMIQNLQAQMLSDPSIMPQMLAVNDDPELKEIFDDPQFNNILADYYANHDLAEIKKYPNSKKILSNPKAMSLIERMTRKK